LISKFNRAYAAAVVSVLLLIGCDQGRCVRNSDCSHLLTCIQGYCVVKPLSDSGVSNKDAAADRFKDTARDTDEADTDADDGSLQESVEEEINFFDPSFDAGR
jgi:hypothetical protein